MHLELMTKNLILLSEDQYVIFLPLKYRRSAEDSFTKHYISVMTAIIFEIKSIKIKHF
jgi:hypothetical protein